MESVVTAIEKEIERYLGKSWGRDVQFFPSAGDRSNGVLTDVYIAATIDPEISAADLPALGEKLNGEWKPTFDVGNRIDTAILDGEFDGVRCHVKLVRGIVKRSR
jgi:hypothetical protein